MRTPEFDGYHLEFSSNVGFGSMDEETCEHPDDRLMTYEEDGNRFCACRDCGTIWEMYVMENRS